MSRFKYDIEINLKNEREIGQLLVFSSVTPILIYVLFSVVNWVDPYWLYLVCFYLTFYAVGIPGLYYFKKNKHSFKELFAGTNWISVIVGVLIALVMGVGVSIVFLLKDEWYLGGYEISNLLDLLYIYFFYVIVVAVSEEFIYRVCFQMLLGNLFKKIRWIVPIISAVGFGLIHTIQGTWIQAGISTVLGLFIGYAVIYIKLRSSYLS